jgi:leucyl-tRNA synthetase
MVRTVCARSGEGPVFRESWRAYDPELAKEDLAEIVVQVNGKLRSHIHLPFGTAEETVKARALEDAKMLPFLDGKRIVKVVAVPDWLVNIVVGA